MSSKPYLATPMWWSTLRVSAWIPGSTASARFVAHDGAEGLPPDGWLPDRISIGVLTRAFPPELVDEVVEATGTREQRRRLLPARLMVEPGIGSVDKLTDGPVGLGTKYRRRGVSQRREGSLIGCDQ